MASRGGQWKVVAVVLIMSGLNKTTKLGNYSPAPIVPFIEEATPAEYDAYDPNDVPDDQAAPEYDDYDDYDPSDIPADQAKDTTGYNYPVPDNPLILPLPTPEDLYDDYDPSDIPDDQAKPAPDCVDEDGQDMEENIKYLQNGIPLCPSEDLPGYQSSTADLDTEDDYDDYDPDDIPDDQAAPLPTYITSTQTPPQYDDYDPNDIPADQAAPSGYSYPVPDNPVQLKRMNKKHKDAVEHGMMRKHQNAIRPKLNTERSITMARENPNHKSNKADNKHDKKMMIMKNKTARKPKRLNVSKRKMKSNPSAVKKSGLSSSESNRKGRQIISVSDWLARG